jgi:hypothetical protein
MATATLRPNGVGASDTWTPNSGSVNWDRLDETGAHDGDTTYSHNNDTSSPHDILLVALGNMPEAPSSVSSVVYRYVMKSAFGTPPVVPVVRISGSNSEGTAHNISTTYTEYSWDITSLATWDETILNGLEVGVRRNTTASNSCRITQAWVEVTYTAGTQVTDTATLVATVADPAVVLGSVSASDVSSLVAAVADPAAVLGSLSLTDTASLVATVVDPTVDITTGAITDIAPLVATVADPAVVLGGLALTDLAAAVATVVDPTTVLGSVSVADVASLVATAVDPAVAIASGGIATDTATLVATAADPVVVLGSLAATDVASLVAAATDPDVGVIAPSRHRVFGHAALVHEVWGQVRKRP